MSDATMKPRAGDLEPLEADTSAGRGAPRRPYRKPRLLPLGRIEPELLGSPPPPPIQPPGFPQSPY